MDVGDHHILIIEDEQPIRRFLRASLSNEGYRVTEAPSGMQGLQMATAQPPDLVILDLGLPDLDGQDVLQRLREWCTAPIIILSARDQEPQKIKALDHGADDYVTKPFVTDELMARIEAVLRRVKTVTLLVKVYFTHSFCEKTIYVYKKLSIISDGSASFTE